MFSTRPKTSFNFSFNFIFSSASTFILDQPKILSFGKELKAFAGDKSNNVFTSLALPLKGWSLQKTPSKGNLVGSVYDCGNKISLVRSPARPIFFLVKVDDSH